MILQVMPILDASGCLQVLEELLDTVNSHYRDNTVLSLPPVFGCSFIPYQGWVRELLSSRTADFFRKAGGNDGALESDPGWKSLADFHYEIDNRRKSVYASGKGIAEFLCFYPEGALDWLIRSHSTTLITQFDRYLYRQIAELKLPCAAISELIPSIPEVVRAELGALGAKFEAATGIAVGYLPFGLHESQEQ